MAIGDKVITGDGGNWDKKVTIPCYSLRFDENGNPIADRYGAYSIKVAGGVLGGLVGVVSGDPIKVHRSDIPTKNETVGFGGVDLVYVVSVYLDHYKQNAIIETNHIKIIGGGAGMDYNSQ